MNLLQISIMLLVSFGLLAGLSKLTAKQWAIGLPLYCLGYYFFVIMSGFVFGPLAMTIAQVTNFDNLSLLQLVGANLGFMIIFGVMLKVFAPELGIARSKETA